MSSNNLDLLIKAIGELDNPDLALKLRELRLQLITAIDSLGREDQLKFMEIMVGSTVGSPETNEDLK
jgi:hypothetical protein